MISRWFEGARASSATLHPDENCDHAVDAATCTRRLKAESRRCPISPQEVQATMAVTDCLTTHSKVAEFNRRLPYLYFPDLPNLDQ